jgi:hypothetical protein
MSIRQVVRIRARLELGLVVAAWEKTPSWPDPTVLPSDVNVQIFLGSVYLLWVTTMWAGRWREIMFVGLVHFDQMLSKKCLLTQITGEVLSMIKPVPFSGNILWRAHSLMGGNSLFLYGSKRAPCIRLTYKHHWYWWISRSSLYGILSNRF